MFMVQLIMERMYDFGHPYHPLNIVLTHMIIVARNVREEEDM